MELLALEFNTYRLTKWRRLLLVRDCTSVTLPNGSTVRQGICVMCRNQMPTWRLQAHHIRPKSLYPELAYNLDNGVMIDVGCHFGCVHSGNSFEDLKGIHNWRFYAPSFDRYVNLATQRKFNEANQQRI